MDHVSIRVSNYEASLHFYDETLKSLGYKRTHGIEEGEYISAGYSQPRAWAWGPYSRGAWNEAPFWIGGKPSQKLPKVSKHDPTTPSTETPNHPDASKTHDSAGYKEEVAQVQQSMTEGTSAADAADPVKMVATAVKRDGDVAIADEAAKPTGETISEGAVQGSDSASSSSSDSASEKPAPESEPTQAKQEMLVSSDAVEQAEEKQAEDVGEKAQEKQTAADLGDNVLDIPMSGSSVLEQPTGEGAVQEEKPELRAGDGVHFAFKAPSTLAVQQWYDKALALGATDNGKPGPRPYHPGYYAAFVIDPDGWHLEAVLHHHREPVRGWLWLFSWLWLPFNP